MSWHEQVSSREAQALQTIYGRTGIDTRYSVLPDFQLYERNHPEALLFRTAEDPTLSARMEVFNREAPKLGLRAAKKLLDQTSLPTQAITHLIAITCTGLATPGLDHWLQKGLGLSPSLKRTAVNYMGCYAALHGLRQAWQIVKAEPEAHVLIVSVELCTLHYRKATDRHLLASQALFGDGAAAVLVSGTNIPKHQPWAQIEELATWVADEYADAMTWHPDEIGFRMHLDAQVPEGLASILTTIKSQKLFAHGRLAPEDFQRHIVHPGGKRILEAYAEAMQLPEGHLALSFSQLAKHGNISSSTILFLLEALFENGTEIPEDDRWLAAAFGPGLTLEMMALAPIGSSAKQ